MAEAKYSVITELKSFATGILSDFQSIENAINPHWSNGPVEGNVNKLKPIKGQMYGKASFDLLRERLVEVLNEMLISPRFKQTHYKWYQVQDKYTY
ncbi:hypothetical protein DRW42_28090 [Pedobacter miscanthi]|uniref:Transposase IS204/IS1001/IS1096/IS1165 DDE domain-containing protein n=1 Tax=Pedobacter miscanthi TaxID=2259170 RepID=A0A366KKB7_9SPHI|nr:hypothetical protein DRW42_28090 [Pedobacter miscanthi]